MSLVEYDYIHFYLCYLKILSSMKKFYLAIIFLLIYGITSFAQYPRAELWKEDIRSFAIEDSLYGRPKDVVLFIGSSTFTRWTTIKEDFPGLNVINRGFGGSVLTDVIYYYDEVVRPYHPSQVVIYEGDNDLIEPTKSVEEFFEDIITITRLIHIHFPEAGIILVSIKPSPSRAQFFPKYTQANQMMKAYAEKTAYIDFVDIWSAMLKADGMPNEDLFLHDMLHMNEKGYRLWTDALKVHLQK